MNFKHLRSHTQSLGCLRGFLCSLFPQAPSAHLLISALICHQWAIEEAQSGLQLKEEVIQQVGAELAPTRVGEVKNAKLLLASTIKICLFDCFFVVFFCLYIFFSMRLRQKEQRLRHAEETKEEFLSTIKVKVLR